MRLSKVSDGPIGQQLLFPYFLCPYLDWVYLWWISTFRKNQLTQDQNTLLNLEIKYHVMSRASEMARKVGLETLLDPAGRHLEASWKVTTNDSAAELLEEGGKTRGNYRYTRLS